MDKKQFNSAVKKIATQSDTLAQLIHETGVAAIELVNNSENTTWGVQLVEALGNKHDKRRVVAWLCHFGKFGWHKEKGLIFRKRKDMDGKAEAAAEMPYWLLTPQQQPKVTYDYLAMIQSIIRKADGVENSEKEIEEKNVHIIEALRKLIPAS